MQALVLSLLPAARLKCAIIAHLWVCDDETEEVGRSCCQDSFHHWFHGKILLSSMHIRGLT